MAGETRTIGLPHSCSASGDTPNPGRDEFHLVPLFPLCTHPNRSAYEGPLRLTPFTISAPLRGGHNFPLIPGNSRLFPVIPSYFQGAPGTQTIKYKDIMKRKTPCGVPIQKISPNLHVIHFAFCIQICISAQERGYSEHLTFCILYSKICNSGGCTSKKIFSHKR
jgi:hypothetical protein